jgi:hypothetical protein
MKPATYVLDSASTGGTRFLDQNSDTVAWVRGDIFPPVGTEIHLPDGSLALVTGLTLDISNASGIAQVWVSVRVECPTGLVVPTTGGAT